METGGARERKRRGRSGNAYEGADWPASEWRPEGRVASRRRAPRLPPRTTTVHPLEVLSVLGDEVDASSRESSPRGWSSSPSSSPRASTTRLANTRHAGQPPNGHPPRGSPSVSRICSAILRRTNRVRFHIYVIFFSFLPSFSSFRHPRKVFFSSLRDYRSGVSLVISWFATTVLRHVVTSFQCVQCGWFRVDDRSKVRNTQRLCGWMWLFRDGGR